MSAVLNNISTEDTYSAANTLICDGAVKVNLIVANAAIYYQLMPRSSAMHPRSGSFNPEVGPVVPTPMASLPRNVDQVRVRSAAKGKPALVSIEAITGEEG